MYKETHQLMVNMQIREQLRWIANNFNLHVTKATAASVHSPSARRQKGYKIGLSFPCTSVCLFDLVSNKEKYHVEKLDN